MKNYNALLWDSVVNKTKKQIEEEIVEIGKTKKRNCISDG